jgi:hypothetical protein
MYCSSSRLVFPRKCGGLAGVDQQANLAPLSKSIVDKMLIPRPVPAKRTLRWLREHAKTGPADEWFQVLVWAEHDNSATRRIRSVGRRERVGSGHTWLLRGTRGARRRRGDNRNDDFTESSMEKPAERIPVGLGKVFEREGQAPGGFGAARKDTMPHYNAALVDGFGLTGWLAGHSTVAGPAGRCVERLAEIAEAGVRIVIVAQFVPDQLAFIRTFATEIAGRLG